MEKNVTRFLLYQGDGRCTHKAWMRVKLHKFATHHNVFMHLLSCEAQRKLFPVLETFPKNPNSNEPTSSGLGSINRRYENVLIRLDQIHVKF